MSVSGMVSRGATAPDFTLEGTRGAEVREFTLSEVAAGRPTVLVFYVYDFSPVCTDQVCEIDDMELLTPNDDIAVLGVSTDGPYSHQRFIAEHDISYPLLTDDEKRVYERYGMVERAEDGFRQPKRGIVLLDADRTVRYQWISEDNWEEWPVDPIFEVNAMVDDLSPPS